MGEEKIQADMNTTSEDSERKFEEADQDETERINKILYGHVKELALLKYEEELRREDSLIQQSGHMQTAFSFMTAAVFMAVPIMMQYNTVLSVRFFLAAVSSIVFFLLASLVAASLAQRRAKKVALDDISELKKFVHDNWEESLSEVNRLNHIIDALSDVQKKLSKLNDQRSLLIRVSMWNFFASIGLIGCWFVVALFYIF